MSRYYLGLDSSTQSLSAILIDAESGQLVYEHSLNYSLELPAYAVTDGFLPSAKPDVVHAPPLMWVEALDQLLLQMQADKLPMSEIVAVAGAAQQHGSVYLGTSFDACLKSCNPQKPLHEQLQDSFTRHTSPIWMDSSTSEQCTAITAALGGETNVSLATGSIAVERFTGAQIKKFADKQPDAYADTAAILLVSSFMASLFAGRHIGIDLTDASGMNLLDIRNKQWHPDALSCCGEQLQDKLKPAVNPQLILGNIAPYFTQRYGFNSVCKVLPWCGDNPSSLIGLGLIEPGMTAVSLGTSDTCFGLFQNLPETMSPWAHTFIAPTLDYMSLLCFKNGALAREAIRQQHQLTWEQFSDCLNATPPGNQGAMMLPWFESEIVPKVEHAGVLRFSLEPTDMNANCRAVIEAQMMAMSNHATAAGLQPTSIRATGGASQNVAILQIMANVFGCPVDVLQTTSNSAALGAALRAVFAIENKYWSETVQPFTQSQQASRILADTSAVPIYQAMKKVYAAREQSYLI
ncbi:MAG: carbohydrate kinase [Methyloprofundus sp.]|nr:carbohydrate kinase [Methyloprofundus sp.]